MQWNKFVIKKIVQDTLLFHLEAVVCFVLVNL